MNERKVRRSSALDEIMVARIEIEGLGVAANEKEMTDSVRALPGVREVKIENGAMLSDLRSARHRGKEDRGSGASERKYGESCNHRHRIPASLTSDLRPLTSDF